MEGGAENQKALKSRGAEAIRAYGSAPSVGMPVDTGLDEHQAVAPQWVRAKPSPAGASVDP
jgi:hypothetical protein